MENASKALIIAGAILLAILIISLGIMIYNQASGVVDSTAMDEVAVTSFNKKFQQYEGKNVRGAQVNALINTIIQNNLSNSEDSSKMIEVDLDSINWNGVNASNTYKYSGQPTSFRGKASTGKSYSVKFDNDTKSGYINKVTIRDAN